jgi:hypothetical protein
MKKIKAQSCNNYSTYFFLVSHLSVFLAVYVVKMLSHLVLPYYPEHKKVNISTTYNNIA